MKPAPEVQKEKRIPNTMLLWVMIVKGTRAASFFRISTAANNAIDKAEITKRIMIREFFHEYSVPPHCRASSRLTIDARKTANAGRSSIAIVFFKLGLAGGFK